MRWRRLLVAVLALAVVTTPAIAGSAVAGSEAVSVSADAASVTAGETTTVTYTVTNEGDEATDALGFRLTDVPSDLTATAFETDGSVADEQQAVFWVEPVDPGESVTVTVTFEAAADATAGEYAVTAEAASNETTTSVEHAVTVEAAAITTTDAGTTTANGGETTAASGGETTAASDGEPTTAGGGDGGPLDRAEQEANEIPGFGVSGAVLALLAVIAAARRR